MSSVVRYTHLLGMVRFARPETIIEIGTHSGKRAALICQEAVKHRESVHYVGYDLFDEATDEISAIEANGKGPGDEAKARERLDEIAAQCPGFSYHLVKGNTRDTLHGTAHCADFVFIDGGHTVETIRGDYEAVRTSRVIALDDYYTGRIDTTKVGCNRIIADVPHVVLPRMDQGNGAAVQIAAIGYDPKWTAALEQCRTHYGLDTISFWRDGTAIYSDLIACINTLEREPDLTETLPILFRCAKKRIFFTLKEDGLRSIAWWKDELSKHLHITEWYGHSGEIVGTGQPIREITGVRSTAVWHDERRLENIKANVAKVSKRVKLGWKTPAHGGRVILACYGPTLKDTWQDIPIEKAGRGGVLVSVSGAHDFLVERGIVPDYHVECDPRPHKAQGLAKGVEGVKYYMASCVHPELIDRLEGFDVSLWHMLSGFTSVQDLAEIEDGCTPVPGGGSVGLRAWVLFYMLGNRNFSVHGMDCSFAADAQHAGVHHGSKQEVIEVFTQDKRIFQSSAVLVAYAEHFKKSLQYMPDCLFEMHGDGLLQHWCQLGHGETEAA